MSTYYSTYLRACWRWMYLVSRLGPSETQFFCTIKYDALSFGKCSGLCSHAPTCLGLWVQNMTMSALPCEQSPLSAWYVEVEVRLMFLVWPRSETYSRPSAVTRARSFARNRPCSRIYKKRLCLELLAENWCVALCAGRPMSRELTVWFNSPDQGNPEKNKKEKCQTNSKQSIKSNYNKQE